MNKKQLRSVRVNILVTVVWAYARGYFMYRKTHKRLKEPYNKSYNLFFIDAFKEMWIAGKIEKSKYIKEVETFRPTLRRKQYEQLR